MVFYGIALAPGSARRIDRGRRRSPRGRLIDEGGSGHLSTNDCQSAGLRFQDSSSVFPPSSRL